MWTDVFGVPGKRTSFRVYCRQFRSDAALDVVESRRSDQHVFLARPQITECLAVRIKPTACETGFSVTSRAGRVWVAQKLDCQKIQEIKKSKFASMDLVVPATPGATPWSPLRESRTGG